MSILGFILYFIILVTTCIIAYCVLAIGLNIQGPLLLAYMGLVGTIVGYIAYRIVEDM